MRSKIAEKNANHLLQIVLFFHLFFDFLSIFFCFDSRAKKTLLYCVRFFHFFDQKVCFQFASKNGTLL